jgi:hypothetical protein
MAEFIKIIAEIVNTLHDLLIKVFQALGFQLTDKELHFWIIGIIGIFNFFFVQAFFKWISEWSITALSFVYTFTVVLVIVFAIEIQQKVTGRGNMEFADAVMGIYGFLAFFGVYLAIRLIAKITTAIYKKSTQKNRPIGRSLNRTSRR